MKALFCQTAKCTGDGRRLGIKLFGRPLVALPNGAPYLVGTPSGFPLVVKCGKCRRPTTYTAQAFAALPRLSASELQALGQLEPLSKDWVGDGLPLEHAAQLVAAGISGPGTALPARSAEMPTPEARRQLLTRRRRKKADGARG